MHSIGQALREMVPCFEPLEPVDRPLLDALGCVLSEDFVARHDLPGFDNSAMDGYAVCLAQVEAQRPLPVQGEARAGGTAPAPLMAGAAMRIFTGARMPNGADTVVIQENAQRVEASVVFDKLPPPGANVRARGSDAARGSLLLARGQALGPGELGLLAAQGCTHARVHRTPRVAILSVGDELRPLGAEILDGTVINSNAYALAAQLRALGAEPWLLPIVADEAGAIAGALATALQADVVLSTGGVSVGEYDLMASAFERSGVAKRFAKVAIKPGKPLWFGMAGRVPVVGLPGNPVSALVTFEIFVRPALRRMLGHEAPYPTPIAIELAHDHRHATGRTELARATLQARTDRAPLATLHALQGSGSLPSVAAIDVIVELPAETAAFAAGTRLRAWPLRPLGFQVVPAFA